MSPLARGETADQRYQVRAPASEAPRPGVATVSGKDESRASRQAPSSRDRKSSTGAAGPERPRGEGPGGPGSIKQEEPGDLAQPQAEALHGPKPIKREEGETSQAEYQEN